MPNTKRKMCYHKVLNKKVRQYSEINKSDGFSLQINYVLESIY